MELLFELLLLPEDFFDEEAFFAEDLPLLAFLAEDFAALLRAGAAFFELDADDFFALLFADDFFALLFAADFLAPPFDDFDEDDLLLLDLELDFLAGIFPPSLLASDKPIAIACFRLVTFFPLPDFRVPSLNLCISVSTLSCDFLPYLAMFAFSSRA